MTMYVVFCILQKIIKIQNGQGHLSPPPLVKCLIIYGECKVAAAEHWLTCIFLLYKHVSI